MKTATENTFTRSPFFYVGDKYKLLPQIVPLFPEGTMRIIEPFVGGGSVFLNARTPEVIANDLDSNVIAIHRLLNSHINDMDHFIDEIVSLAHEYGLSCSYDGDSVAEKLKTDFPKTYFAQANREGYLKLRERFNNSENLDFTKLYVLMIYGFNRMLRFNGKGKFNIPVGNVDLNLNVIKALQGYAENTLNRSIEFKSLDFESFFNGIKFKQGDLVYVDPPYLITASEYNRNWDEDSERRLYKSLDLLDSVGVNFMLSNVIRYEDKVNDILIDWTAKHKSFSVKSNYINHTNNQKKKIQEVLVVNYG